jgi:hypothetical protein
MPSTSSRLPRKVSLLTSTSFEAYPYAISKQVGASKLLPTDHQFARVAFCAYIPARSSLGKRQSESLFAIR